MLYLDIETLNLFADVAHLPRPAQLAALHFGLATVYDARQECWTQYWSAALPRWTDCVSDAADLHVQRIIQHDDALGDLWNAVCAGGPIVGWNVIEFDLAYLILHRWRHDPAALDTAARLTLVDPFAVLRRVSRELTGRERWYRLDAIARATLGRGKESDGAQSSQWLASGDPALVRQAAAYCRADVQMLVDLLHAATTTGLRCPPRPERGEQGALHVRLDAQGNIVAATVTPS